MPNRIGKIAVFAFLAVVGTALVVYGLTGRSFNVGAKDPNDSTVTKKSETELTKEVTIGGVHRDESGTLRKTYDKTPPKACPT